MVFTDNGKILVLNFLEVENIVFFWAKKLMERWYMLGLFEVFMILQDLGNMFFRAVRVVVIRKSSFKNNIRKMHVETVYIQNISPDQIRRKIFWRYANWNMTQPDLSVNFLFTFLKGTRSILIKFAKICVKEGWGMNWEEGWTVWWK